MRNALSRAADELSAARLLGKLSKMEWLGGRSRPQPGLWAKGFLSDRAGLYPFNRFHRELFVTDWEIEARLAHINPAAILPLLGDKLLFHLLLDRLGIPVRRAPLVGLVTNGRFTPLGDFGTWEEAAREPLIAKPARGSGGRGVIRLEPGSPPPCGAGLLVERCVDTHRYARTIFPRAVNTVRVMTARDPLDGELFILGTAHRFGTARSAPTDNRKQGGIVSAIDPADGTLSPAVGLGRGNRRLEHSTHPETGAKIAGVVVPHWRSVVRTALDLANAFPDLVLAGWDFAVGDDGPLIIEGNAALPNPNLLQAHAPLLIDERARRLMQFYGVISAERARHAELRAGQH